MEREVVGIEKIHSTVGTESVGNDGYPVVGNSLVTAVEFHIIGISFVSCKVVHERALNARRTYDEVYLAARVFFEGVDGLLNDRFGYGADARLDIRHEPLMRASRKPVNGAARIEYRAETGYLLIVRALNGHERVGYDHAAVDGGTVDGDFLVVSVDSRDTSCAVTGEHVAGRISYVDDETFDEVFNVVDGERVAAYGNDFTQYARTVAVEHSAEVERGRF